EDMSDDWLVPMYHDQVMGLAQQNLLQDSTEKPHWQLLADNNFTEDIPHHKLLLILNPTSNPKIDALFDDMNKKIQEAGSPIDEHKWKEHLDKKPFCSPISAGYQIKGHF